MHGLCGWLLTVWLISTPQWLLASAAGGFTIVDPIPLEKVTSTEKEPERLIASLLTIGLGTFGAHRLYLGTTPKVPIVYGLTFGGFGVLAVIDLGHILFTKDLSVYKGSRQVFMWAGPHKELTPP